MDMQSATDAAFAQVLRDLIRAKGLTQEDFALLAETNRVNVSKVLSGKEGVSLDRAATWAGALGLRVAFLPAEDGPEEKKPVKKVPKNRVKTRD